MTQSIPAPGPSSPSFEADRAIAVRLQMALAVAGLGTWDWDPENDQITWNDEHERICGFVPGTFAGKAADFYALVLPEDLPILEEAMRRSREDHVEYRCEFRIRRHNDGAIRWVASRGAFFFDALGRPLWASGIIGDITERREAEAAAKAMEERRRLFFEGNPVPMFITCPETRRYLDVNDAAVAQYGYSRDEFLQMRADDLRPADDVERMRQAFRDPREGRPARGTWRHLTKDGRILRVEIISHDAELDGRHVLVVSAIDLTERTADPEV